MEDNFITRNDRFPKRGRKGKCPNNKKEWEIEDEDDRPNDRDDEDDKRDDSDDSDRDDDEDKEEGHRCNYAHERVVDGPDDFMKVHEGNKLYNDISFPEKDRIRWDDMPHMAGEGLSEHEGKATWLRV